MLAVIITDKQLLELMDRTIKMARDKGDKRLDGELLRDFVESFLWVGLNRAVDLNEEHKELFKRKGWAGDKD